MHQSPVRMYCNSEKPKNLVTYSIFVNSQSVSRLNHNNLKIKLMTSKGVVIKFQGLKELTGWTNNISNKNRLLNFNPRAGEVTILDIAVNVALINCSLFRLRHQDFSSTQYPILITE